MKLLKCTFRTPLNGSIDCEILRSDLHGPKELNSEQMATLYHRCPQLKEFLDDNKEDLTNAIPDELSSCIVKAEFGDYTMYEGNIYLLTHVWLDEHELTEETRVRVQDWILGQMSDGWGEGIEQRSWMDERVYSKYTYFDEYELSFEQDETYCEASYYVRPWVSHNYYVELVDYDLEEVNIEGNVVAHIDVPYSYKRVIRFDTLTQLYMFVKDGWGKDMARDITNDISEYACGPADRYFYYICAVDSPNGCSIIPKWIISAGKFCSLFEPDKSCEDANYASTQMPLEKAIIELLK